MQYYHRDAIFIAINIATDVDATVALKKRQKEHTLCFKLNVEQIKFKKKIFPLFFFSHSR